MFSCRCSSRLEENCGSRKTNGALLQANMHEEDIGYLDVAFLRLSLFGKSADVWFEKVPVLLRTQRCDSHMLTAMLLPPLQSAHPVLQVQGPRQEDDGNLDTTSGVLQDITKASFVENPEGGTNHVLTYFNKSVPVFRHGRHRPPNNICFSPPVQNFSGNDPCQGASKQRTALARTNELFRGNGANEFQKIAIQKGVTFLMQWLRRKSVAS